MKINFNFNIQTHLFVGSSSILNKKVIELLKAVFCVNNICNSCICCIQISKGSYEQFLWVRPTKQYNLEQIDAVIQNMSFKLNHGEKFFIVFEQADLLTVACSNRLLKSIEEPSAGYYFIFLTERPQNILPTILSRCVTTSFDEEVRNDFFTIENSLKQSEIGKFFITFNNDPIEFLKLIDKSTISEYDSVELLDNLIHYWGLKYKNELINNNKTGIYKIEKIINILHKAFTMPPMPGSSKIFWKNLYINWLGIN